MRHPRSSITLLVLAVLFASTIAAAQPPQAGATGGPTRPGSIDLQHANCTTPTTATVRGKAVEFDQCLDRAFTHNSTNYRVHVYYTEGNSTTNTNQCSAAENTNGRCEHALSNNDDGSGNNVNAVAMAVEAELAFRFYIDRSLSFLGAGNDELNIYIAEDPRTGGVIYPNSIYVDDDYIDNNDTLRKRLLAFHEVQHLVQDKYDNGGIGWNDFYGEGIARAIEDRADTALDADTGHLFIPEVDGILSNDGQRSSDLSTINYRSVLWWTWLMDQYRLNSETAPVQGWSALLDFYTELNSESNQLKAIRDFIAAKGSSFDQDFIDYTLALYAFRYAPSDARLGFLDSEISARPGLSGHTVITGGPAFSTSSQAMNPRSSRYWEFSPANQCDFVAFSFDGNSQTYAFSVMTVDGGTLQKRWTSKSTGWSRTVRSKDLDRVVGVVTALDNGGTVDIGRGCVKPTLNIKNPTTSAFEMVGLPTAPRQFIVRLKVTGADGSAVAGLTASDFQIQLRQAGTSTILPATIVNSAYVQDDYWLLVQAPNDAAGAVGGAFYDLIASLGTETDTELSSVLYVERTQDVMIVLDRSGSMGGGTGRIESARNAATLLVNELADGDQGGYVAFDTNASLVSGMDPVGSGPGSHRDQLQTQINNTVPLDFTSIGDGMKTAAVEEDAQGVDGHLCSFVLLSDGHENEPEYWNDVRTGVVDNGCAIHAIGLGPGANEVLLQQIAGSVPGGSYDYADVSGNVPLGMSATPTLQATIPWQNNLSRIYDFKAAQVAGRQRIFSAARTGRETQECDEHRFVVDETTGKLVVAIGWQNDSKGTQQIQLFDQDGNPAPASTRRLSPFGTNEVWEVPDPKPGTWRLCVKNLFQPYFVSSTARTSYEMYLFIGTPIASLTQGVQVPLLVTFVGRGKPLTDADVTALVRAPNGAEHNLRLYDDGSHGDSEANDGIYGNWYTATSLADLVQSDKVVENQEPQQIGSYLVNAVGIKGDIHREAQGSFVIEQGADADGDRLPDLWEQIYGADTKSPDDAGKDLDRDKLTNFCELQLGTDPRDSDTDDGGESDGSEAPGCQPIRDPLNPIDDRIGPLTHVHAFPKLTLAGNPFIHVLLGAPARGTFLSAEIWRRVTNPDGSLVQDWQIISTTTSLELSDLTVQPGRQYQYEVVPTIGFDALVTQQAAPAAITPAEGPTLTSNVALASADPYPPTGSVLIDGGKLMTNVRVATLTLSADDSGGGHDGGPDDSHPGTPVDQLQMRISNSPDFTNVAWEPFKATVPNWTLAPGPRNVATVYVQFKDAQGNISETGLAQADTIVVIPPLHLPIILR